MKKNYIVLVIVALAAGGIGFFGGMKYQESRRISFAGRFGNGMGMQGNRMGFRPVNGEIIASDDKTITVKLSDGSSKIVILSESTIINKADQATKEDLKTGEKAVVFGTENSDGSVTAQNIQLNPQFRTGRATD